MWKYYKDIGLAARMTKEAFFGTMKHMKRHTRYFAIYSVGMMACFFALSGIMATAFVAVAQEPSAQQNVFGTPTQKVETGKPAFDAMQAQTEQYVQGIEAGGKEIQAQKKKEYESTGRSTEASAAPSGKDLYTPRYMPDILKGAQGPAEMVFLIYKYLMGLVGIVAVGVIIYGGVLRTISADPGRIKVSNEYIKNALKGIVLLFGAQVLFNTINPNIIDIARIQKALQPAEKITPKQFTETGISLSDEESASIYGTPEERAAQRQQFANMEQWAKESAFERSRYGGYVGTSKSQENSLARMQNAGVGVKPGVLFLSRNAATGEISAASLAVEGELVGLGKAVGSGKVTVTSVLDGHNTADLANSKHHQGIKFDIRDSDAGGAAVTSYIRANFEKMPDGTDWVDGAKIERYKNPATGAVYVHEYPSKTYRSKDGTTKTRSSHWDVDTAPK